MANMPFNQRNVLFYLCERIKEKEQRITKKIFFDQLAQTLCKGESSIRTAVHQLQLKNLIARVPKPKKDCNKPGIQYKISPLVYWEFLIVKQVFDEFKIYRELRSALDKQGIHFSETEKIIRLVEKKPYLFDSNQSSRLQ